MVTNLLLYADACFEDKSGGKAMEDNKWNERAFEVELRRKAIVPG